MRRKAVYVCKALGLYACIPKEPNIVAIDPVCGMEVDEKASKEKSKLEENIFYFCCPNYKSRFDKNPSKFMTQTK